MNMKQAEWVAILKKNKAFYIASLAFICLGLSIALTHSKTASSLLINGFHSSWADTFFTYYTYVGDFWSFTLLLIVSLFISYRQTVVVAMSALVTTLIAQSIKHGLSYPRPSAVITPEQGFHIVPGIDLHSALSFPSGHTTAAFGAFTLIALITSRKQFGWFWALVAALVAYSRIYLGQHFLEDTIAGALIGIVVSSLCYGWGYNDNSPLNEKKWAERALIAK